MAKTPDGRRIAMAERQVQEVIARYLLSLKDELPGLVTVSRVQMPADLRTARVYVSVFAQDQDESLLKKQVAKTLQHLAADIQGELAAHLKMRYCPKLTFYPDETTDVVLKVERLIEDISPSLRRKRRGDDDE
ncbi:MAG: 30S ribosome-binding factor RbfA [Bdellovibrionaceae bacterium]|nr:30S ribosome-binding factor RbfA [Pseudobdellovibrionaceae bacterium]MBX3033439.1 30S ribosome-binding factor RbfA [Pseudobdellovibrionaceae bacterium]